MVERRTGYIIGGILYKNDYMVKGEDRKSIEIFQFIIEKAI